MYRIDVGAADEATLIFTVTARWQAPWGAGNTTILVPAEQLAPLIHSLQARLPEVQTLRAATPAFVAGQQVRITGSHRQGHVGTVIEIQPTEVRGAQGTGERWSCTVYFEDGTTWRYNAGELAPMGGG